MKKEPKDFYKIVSRASMECALNETVIRLSRDDEAVVAIHSVLRKAGQQKFINLVSSSEDARISMALYAGDGLVAKIIPADYAGRTPDVIYHLPAITKIHVETRERPFLIKFYPWVSPGNITPEQVLAFDKDMRRFGQTINNDDAYPRNVHRLPDRDSTPVGVDADMYHFLESGSRIPDVVRETWHEHIHGLFPVYKEAKVKPQTTKTNFSFTSMHDKAAETTSFAYYSKPQTTVDPIEKAPGGKRWWHFGR